MGTEGKAAFMSGPTIHWDLEQGTDRWHAMRAGKWGSSCAGVIMGGLDTKGLDSLIQDIAWGRVFGPIEGGYKNTAMERGQLMEPESRDWYAFEKRAVVREAGLVEHASVPHVIWSPDGLIDPHGAIEAKNPLHKAWMQCKRTRFVPAEYRWQCKWAMWVGELEWIDFVCYHHRAGGMVIRCEPNPSEADQMESRVYDLEKKVSVWIDVIADRKAA